MYGPIFAADPNVVTQKNNGLQVTTFNNSNNLLGL